MDSLTVLVIISICTNFVANAAVACVAFYIYQVQKRFMNQMETALAQAIKQVKSELMETINDPKTYDIVIDKLTERVKEMMNTGMNNLWNLLIDKEKGIARQVKESVRGMYGNQIAQMNGEIEDLPKELQFVEFVFGGKKSRKKVLKSIAKKFAIGAIQNKTPPPPTD